MLADGQIMREHLGGHSPNEYAASLSELRLHDHACLVFDEPAELLEAVVEFLTAGLDRAERCFCALRDGLHQPLHAGLRDAGVDSAAACAERRLILTTDDNAYAKPGFFDIERMMTFWRTQIDEATADGFRGLRVVGDSSWTATRPDCWLHVGEYEARAEALLRELPAIALCLYDRTLLPDNLIREALRTHQYVMHQGLLIRNPYFLPPEHVIEGRADARAANWLLQNLVAREQMERAFRENEERLSLVIESAELGVWDWNLVTGESTLGAGWATRLDGGDQVSNAGGAAWRELIHHEDRLKADLRLNEHLRGATGFYEVEYRLRCARGNWIWVLDRGRALDRDANGRASRMTGTMLDITECKLAHKDRERMDAQLRHAQKVDAIGQLAGGMAHDFGNLLTTVLGSIEKLEELLAQDAFDARVADDIQRIREAAVRGHELTHKLAAFSNKEPGRPALVNVNQVLGDMDSMLRRLIPDNINLRLLLAHELPPTWTHCGQLERVVLNMVVNACDAMPAGGRLEIQTASVSLDEEYARENVDAQPGWHVLLRIRDTGYGIADDVRERIFEPFFTTKELGSGAGLGLAAAYGVVKRSGGHIRVVSAPGKGAEFDVYLPVADKSATENADAAQVVPNGLGGDETILICEDEPAVRDLFVDAFRRHGYNVIAASRADEALEQAEACNEPIDMLVTDVSMPGMNGRELRDKLRSMRAGLRTLFVSGYTAKLLSQDGTLEEGVEVLAKPCTVRELLRRVRTILDDPAEPVPASAGGVATATRGE